MYHVSVLIPDLGDEGTPEEAAEDFWKVLDEYRQGGLGTIYIDVQGGGKRSIVPLDPVTGKVTDKR